MESDKTPCSVRSEESPEANMTAIREGKAEILFPKSGTSKVFYNPVQEFNRDLSSAALKVFVENNLQKREPKKSSDNTTRQQNDEEQEKRDSNITLLEALSATGFRAVRYALEVPGIDNIIANDISKDAYQRIQKNIKDNKVNNIVTPTNQDASLLMYQHRYPASKRFTIIDLDPYGSAAPFLDAAVQALDDGGLLMVTCTDMGVLCGNHSDACYGKYGSMSLKAKFCHEMALRIVLSSIESHANRYKRYIVPLLCISVDFYVRVFVKVYTSPSEVKRSPSKQSYVYHCVGCGTYHFQPVGRRIEVGNSKKYPPAIGPSVGTTCIQCGSKFHVGGPIWTEPMHSVEFCKDVRKMVQANCDDYNTSQRIIGILCMVEEELPEIALYYTLNHLSNVLHCNTPSIVQFRSAVLSLGYQVSGTHASGTAIKTNAPNSVIWDIMRCWVKKHPVKRKSNTSPGTVILSKDPEVEATFDRQAAANPLSRKKGLLRFQPNPEVNWGPQTRATRKDTQESQTDKRQRLQGKRKHADSNQTPLKKYPCKRFKAGNCDLGETCRYSHDDVPSDGDEKTDTPTDVSTGSCTPEDETTHSEQPCSDSMEQENTDERHRSVEIQRRNSVMEAEHSLLF